ncbi:hypothetical protein [Dokdonella fugitiva]|uniref:hypothetical protein n=1 Tax=Dokdonella fugitiva TaxID=328517 RepID=UPI001F542BE6|nr:hypothetical protein [Dokdonella fugitiva]
MKRRQPLPRLSPARWIFNAWGSPRRRGRSRRAPGLPLNIHTPVALDAGNDGPLIQTTVDAVPTPPSIQ